MSSVSGQCSWSVSRGVQYLGKLWNFYVDGKEEKTISDERIISLADTKEGILAGDKIERINRLKLNIIVVFIAVVWVQSNLVNKRA